MTTHLVANKKISLATFDSIPNVVERKEKNERKKEEERCSADPQPKEGVVQTHDRRLDLAGHWWNRWPAILKLVVGLQTHGA
jgi:hypothetical protein